MKNKSMSGIPEKMIFDLSINGQVNFGFIECVFCETKSASHRLHSSRVGMYLRAVFVDTLYTDWYNDNIFMRA